MDKIAKAYLKQIKWKSREIEDYKEEIVMIETRLQRITPVMTGMPSGYGSTDKFSDMMDPLIAYRNKLNDCLVDYIKLKSEAIDIIRQIEDGQLRQILYKHYILGKEFNLISVEMNYGYHYTCHRHATALKEFGKLLNDSKQ